MPGTFSGCPHFGPHTIPPPPQVQVFTVGVDELAKQLAELQRRPQQHILPPDQASARPTRPALPKSSVPLQRSCAQLRAAGLAQPAIYAALHRRMAAACFRRCSSAVRLTLPRWACCAGKAFA